LGDFFFVGTACALSVVAAGGLGYVLDSRLGTTPWITFAGLAFGITCAVLLAYNNFRKFV
jgi:F0F1-type ATP synthase assembly protein I